MRRTIPFLVLVLALGIGIGRAASNDVPDARTSAATQQAQRTGDAADTAPQYLFAHDARAGTFSRVAGRPGVFTLALTGVLPTALYFTDRPDRVVGSLSVRNMLRVILGNDGAPKPNAAISVIDLDGHQVLMGVELISAAYHPGARTLDYTVRKLKQGEEEVRHPGLTDHVLPRRFGDASILVDDFVNLCAGWLNNGTNQKWTLQSATLNNSHDNWGDDNSGYPPTTIELPPVPGTESDTDPWEAAWVSWAGFARGCSNTVVYKGADGTIVTVYVSAAYFGPNTYTCTSSSKHYTCALRPEVSSVDDSGDLRVNFDLTHT